MKKLFIITVFTLFTLTTTNACDICGCINGNFQIGLLPNFNKGFVGYRYGASRFNSHLKSDHSQFSHDHYQTMELWGGYNLKKTQVMAFVPYVFAHKATDDGATMSNGLGDVLFLVNHQVLNSASLSRRESVTMRNELYVGGGIKLPTGQVNASSPDFNMGDFNSQAGTGSTDFMLNATHNLMWNRSGIVTNVAYRINTTNAQMYRFGNRAYVNSAFYYTITKSSVTVKPNLGFNYQSNAMNTCHGMAEEGSNGYNLSGTIGVNLLRKNFGINVTTAIPVAQNMNDGQTKLHSRFLAGVTYSF